MGPWSSLACSLAKCFISSTLRLVSFSFGAKSSMDCRVEGVEGTVSQSKNGLLGECTSHQWAMAVSRAVRPAQSSPVPTSILREGVP